MSTLGTTEGYDFSTKHEDSTSFEDSLESDGDELIHEDDSDTNSEDNIPILLPQDIQGMSLKKMK